MSLGPTGGSSAFPSAKVIAGYDFVNGDTNPMDDHGHGTHCAGIVAANGASTCDENIERLHVLSSD